jgi:hypothetical protein
MPVVYFCPGKSRETGGVDLNYKDPEKRICDRTQQIGDSLKAVSAYGNLRVRETGSKLIEGKR